MHQTSKRGAWLTPLLLLLLTLVWQPSAPSRADDASGSNYYYKTNPYYKWDYDNGYSVTNPWLIYQCTWYVWGRCKTAGWDIGYAGGANGELAGAKGSGTGTKPLVGAIQCSKSVGSSGQTIYHVAYVYHVDSDTSWQVEQYNVVPNQYSTGTVTRSSAGSTILSGGGFRSFELLGFVYPPGTAVPPPPAGIPPAKPVELGPNGVSTGSYINFHWQYPGSLNGTTFRVFIDGPQSFGRDVSGSTQTVFGPIAYGTYTWRVEARSAYGSASSDTMVVKHYAPRDFNQDGWTDLLFRASNSRALMSYSLRGGTVVPGSAWTIVNSMDAEWRTVGTPDINKDGMSDLLFQSDQTGRVMYYLLNGGQVVPGSASDIVPNMPLEWKVVSTSDIDGDGNHDLVFQSSISGAIIYYRLDGDRVIPYSSTTIVDSLPPNQKLVGTPDINHDGKPDLLFQLTDSGAVIYYLLDAGKIVPYSANTIVNSMDSVWKVTGTTDVIRDGNDDLIFQSTNSRAVMYYLLNGGQVVPGSANAPVSSMDAVWWLVPQTN